ncbi:hypothetical protein [Nonomuraea candida]|uniref:hypothetical protein n=1 Tax=Nonomuraea candida TaxID=359159 RepID=UPI000A943916|nr:hypothetical protein [Nonomuraea candida]
MTGESAVAMTRRFPGWVILDGAGGGYIAYRTEPVSGRSGLSNVRCGADLAELYEHLEQEMRGQERSFGRRQAS